MFLEKGERVANKLLRMVADVTFMYNFHTVSKSGQVNGALVRHGSPCNFTRMWVFSFSNCIR